MCHIQKTYSLYLLWVYMMTSTRHAFCPTVTLGRNENKRGCGRGWPSESGKKEGQRTPFPIQQCQIHTHDAHRKRVPCGDLCQMRVWYITAVTATSAHSSTATIYCSVRRQWNPTWGIKQDHLPQTRGKWVFNQKLTAVKGQWSCNDFANLLMDRASSLLYNDQLKQIVNERVGGHKRQLGPCQRCTLYSEQVLMSENRALVWTGLVILSFKKHYNFMYTQHGRHTDLHSYIFIDLLKLICPSALSQTLWHHIWSMQTDEDVS